MPSSPASPSHHGIQCLHPATLMAFTFNAGSAFKAWTSLPGWSSGPQRACVVEMLRFKLRTDLWIAQILAIPIQTTDLRKPFSSPNGSERRFYPAASVRPLTNQKIQRKNTQANHKADQSSITHAVAAKWGDASWKPWLRAPALAPRFRTVLNRMSL